MSGPHFGAVLSQAVAIAPSRKCKQGEQMNAIYLISDENLSDIAGLQAQRVAKQWDCDVHVFIERQNHAVKINEIAKNPRVFYHYEELSPFLPDGLPATQKWPHVVYLRLFAAQILKQYQRLLYIDADVLSIKSDPNIWNLTLPAGIGAVSDVATLNRPPYDIKNQTRAEWLEDIGVSSGLYLNSGVLLLDVEKMSQIDFSAELKQYFKSYPKAARFDQDFLASLFDGQWTELSPRMNFQAYNLELGFTKAVDPILIHFCRAAKPWHGWPDNGWRCPASPSYTQIYLDMFAEADLNPKEFERPNTLSRHRRIKYWLRNKLRSKGYVTKRERKDLKEWKAKAEGFANFYSDALRTNRFADDKRSKLPACNDNGFHDGRFARSLESRT